MNQKQRDILCKMVEEDASRLKKQVRKSLPLLRITHDRYPLKHYDTDKLCELPASALRRHKTLRNKQKSLEDQAESLNEEWGNLVKDMEQIFEAEEQRRISACLKVNDAVRTAIIDIQFATDAAQAHKILSSLPDISELIA